jgi:hypothetical protein
MRLSCTRCGCMLGPHASYCSRCGGEIGPIIGAVGHAGPAGMAPSPLPNPVATVVDAQPMGYADLAMATRCVPVTDGERIKAMIMVVAARGDNATVGYWCDD